MDKINNKFIDIFEGTKDFISLLEGLEDGFFYKITNEEQQKFLIEIQQIIKLIKNITIDSYK